MATVKSMAGSSVRLKSTVVQARSERGSPWSTGHAHAGDEGECCAGEKGNEIADQLIVEAGVWGSLFLFHLIEYDISF